MNNNIAFDANVTNIFILALINFNAILIREDKENRIISYLIFSEREGENIDDFINNLKKAFAINRVANGRKHIVTISCLKSTTTSYCNKFNKITNWNNKA